MGQNNSSSERPKPQTGQTAPAQGPVYTREQLNYILRMQQEILDNAKKESQKSPAPSSSSTSTSRTPAADNSSRVHHSFNFNSVNEPARPVPSPMYPSLSSTNTSQLDRPQVTSVPSNSFATPNYPLQPNYPPQAYTSYTPTGNFAPPPQRTYQPQVQRPTAPRGCAEQFVMVQNQHQRFAVPPSAPPAAVVSTSSNTNTKTFKPNIQKKNQDGPVSCVSCKKPFGSEIYQCAEGHSSCDNCKKRNIPCGTCKLPISNTRNYTMESALENVNSPCLNAEKGCRLSFMMKEMQLHLKECPYSKMKCPVASMLGTTCYWTGDVSEIAEHFNFNHIEQCQSNVDKEMQIFNIKQDCTQIHFVELGIYKFLVLLKISKQENNMYMTVQFLGTKVSADKWTYEFHVFNKSEPRRKYQYNDSCQSLGTPLNDIFDGNSACLPLKYASTFSNRGSLAYKFYIKKTVDDKEFSNSDGRADGCSGGRSGGRGGGRSRGRGRGRGAKRGGLSRPTTPDPKI